MNSAERACPRCAEAIKPEAKACPHCGADFFQLKAEDVGAKIFTGCFLIVVAALALLYFA